MDVRWAKARVASIDTELALLASSSKLAVEKWFDATDKVGAPTFGNPDRLKKQQHADELGAHCEAFTAHREALIAERQVLQSVIGA